MARLSKTATAKDRFDHLLKVIASERFLKKQGLGNEVPFFICPYPAEEAVGMEAMRASLLKQLRKSRCARGRDQPLRPQHRAAARSRHLG